MDLTNLLRRGSSPSPQSSSAEAGNEMRQAGSQSHSSSHPHHLFSRHSVIGQMQIIDDSADVAPQPSHICADVQESHSSSVKAAHEMSHVVLPNTLLDMAPVHQASDFAIGNAFEGAFDDIDITLNNMYWGSYL